MDELKPCPFCGTPEPFILHVDGRYSVLCSHTDCGAEGPVDLGRSGAIEAWNTRAETVKAEVVG